MNTFVIILLTLIIFISIIATFYLILYNRIQYSVIRIEEAERVIIDELQNRYELIQESKKPIEKNTKMDLNIFSDLEKVKKANISSYDLEKKITEAISTIYIVKNDYPKLLEKKEFKEIIRKLEESDTKLDAAKSFYNTHNTVLIKKIKAFPSNIIALIHGIKIRPYYDAKEIFNEIDDGIKI